MGYNLYLACHTCREAIAVSRGKEAWAIKAWAKLHRGQHVLDCGVDNGFSEDPWWFDNADASQEYPTAFADEAWLEQIWERV